ncbi:hypothetical protein B1C78_14395 [Thioalkalivibrio denitrificans]|uniref:RNA polymerase sigma factor n=1 Tax=Thioalkalivibrio denitrificans TaxID=108003 RepID=A0A1V3NC00_9GAMM|nr:RNA polymerase sigma factor [Thioalkalivibrio denitrificans]OOG22627.1 hypothetical protein B1C78_14395 [Thioalkalivibrio denitrificans]
MTSVPVTKLTTERAAELDEESLLCAARAQDEAAIRELIRRFNPRLFRIARGIVQSDADAEDVVQETYVSAFRRLSDFRGEARFATWLSRIAVNTALMRQRSRWRDHVPLDTVEEKSVNERVVTFPSAAVDDPYQQAGRQQIRQILEAAVAELPAPLRVVFLMRETEGMSILAISRDLNINPVTVKTRLFRARRSLRKQLEVRIRGGFDVIFPFAGARCAGMAERVVRSLTTC